MKIYAVEQRYFDRGRVVVKKHLLEMPFIPKSYSEEHERYDFYVDYFVDENEAEAFMQQAMNA